MYFEEPAEVFDRTIPREVKFILVGAALFVTFFIIRPGVIVEGAASAARMLLAG